MRDPGLRRGALIHRPGSQGLRVKSPNWPPSEYLFRLYRPILFVVVIQESADDDIRALGIHIIFSFSAVTIRRCML